MIMFVSHLVRFVNTVVHQVKEGLMMFEDDGFVFVFKQNYVQILDEPQFTKNSFHVQHRSACIDTDEG